MGFNTTIVVLNDCIGDIEKNTNLGKQIADAIREKAINHEPIRAAQGVTVIETHHADSTVLVAVGGNLGRVVTSVYGYNADDSDIAKAMVEKTGTKIHHKKPTLEEVKKLAKEYGWRCITLRRKPKMTIIRKRIS